MKLPNGYGNITKLPGNRRNPWRVRKTDGWEMVDGRVRQKYINIGCFETKALALQALADFNKDGKVTSADARLILRKAAYFDN